jgi:hypothetical protein
MANLTRRSLLKTGFGVEVYLPGNTAWRVGAVSCGPALQFSPDGDGRRDDREGS